MFRLPVLLSFLALVAIGCSRAPSEPPPETHPAKGKIIDRSGQPLTGGMVQLSSGDEIPKTATGQVGADGSFELVVMDIEGNKHPGAKEGEYTVTYIPVMSAAQTETPVELPAKVRIQAGENVLDLKLP